MKKIVHIVEVEKFTEGYVNFMKIRMLQQEHFFILLDFGKNLKLVDQNRIYWISDYKELLFNIQIRKILLGANKIIISGLFACSNVVTLFGPKIIKKTYIHFWGADFYNLRNKNANLKEGIKRILKYRCFKKCAGLIFLIDGEYEKFIGITHIHNKSFVAPMPLDPQRRINYDDYRIHKEKESIPIRILVGNSATETNQHIEVFKILKDFPLDKIEVYVPLSYGNNKYRELVLKEGNRILGTAFHPILEYMEIEKYTKLLSLIDVGIFNNNRQQAMGNINALLALGAKLFLKKGTSMWDKYKRDGYIIYPTEAIKDMGVDDFAYFSVKEKTNNEEIFDEINSPENICYAWNKIFSS